MRLLAECFETLGGTPKVVLADWMGCLKGGVVAANVVVPTEFVRFATHYGSRPDFCEVADPKSKGVVKALCATRRRTSSSPRMRGRQRRTRTLRAAHGVTR